MLSQKLCCFFAFLAVFTFPVFTTDAASSQVSSQNTLPLREKSAGIKEKTDGVVAAIPFAGSRLIEQTHSSDQQKNMDVLQFSSHPNQFNPSNEEITAAFHWIPKGISRQASSLNQKTDLSSVNQDLLINKALIPPISGNNQSFQEVSTLDQALLYAENHPDLIAARGDLEKNVEAYKQAYASGGPSVSLEMRQGAGSSYRHQTQKGPDSLTGINTTSKTRTFGESLDASARVSLQQPIYAGGGIAAAKKRAEAGVRSSVFAYVQKMQEVLKSIAEDFFSIALMQEKLALAKQKEELSTLVFYHAQALARAGQQKATDMDASLSRVAMSTSAYKDSESSFNQMRNNFCSKLKLNLAHKLIFPRFESYSVKAMDLATIINNAQKKNPALLARLWGCYATEFAAKQTLAARYPSVRLEANASGSLSWSENKTRMRGSDVFPDPTSMYNETPISGDVAIVSSIPLYTGGRLAADYRTSQIDVRNARIGLDQFTRQLNADCQNAFGSFVVAKKNLVATRVAAQAAIKALNAGFTEYVAGLVALSDALYHQDLWQAANESHLNAKKDVFQSALQMLMLMGQLNFDTLKINHTKVVCFDPIAYVRQQLGHAFNCTIDKRSSAQLGGNTVSLIQRGR